MKRILITGAHGFVGRNLTKKLNGYKLVLTDQAPNLFDAGDASEWDNVHNVHHAELNEDLYILQSLLKGVDTVIHLAASTRIPRSWSRYQEYYDTNIGATAKFFQLCQTMGVNKFIHFSSSSVYGNNGTDIQTEDSPLIPTSPYAVSKVAGEMALKVQAEGHSTELVIVRPFTMYGDYMARDENALVIGKFLEALKNDEPLTLHDAGRPMRDFLHSDDAVDGIRLIIEHGRHGDIFNLGSGTSVSIKQLADCVSQKQVIAPNRRGPVDKTCADISKLRALGFSPKINVLEWLTDAANEVKLEHNIKQTEEA